MSSKRCDQDCGSDGASAVHGLLSRERRRLERFGSEVPSCNYEDVHMANGVALEISKKIRASLRGRNIDGWYVSEVVS